MLNFAQPKNIDMKKYFAVAAFVVPVFLVSCGNDSNKASDKTETTPTTTETSSTDNGGTTVSNTVEITANDGMKFDKIEIRVKANEKVTLTLRNIGKMPVESMGHNFVLLKEGVNQGDFALKGNQAAPDYLPDDMTSSIVAHTKILGPGESETIEFTVPAGNYTYICTFPGHYPSMMGILTAE